MTSSHSELFVKLDRRGPESLSRQLQNALRNAIREGSLRSGVTLPSTRVLAADLGISRPLVLEAYDQLAAEGYLRTRPGARPVVADVSGVAVAAGEKSRDRQAPIHHDLRPAIPDLSMFPRKAWLKALKQAINSMPASAFGYADRHGTPSLRRVLADYLGRVRGVVADPDRIVITSGFAEARALACSALKAAGVVRLGVEDPSYSAWQSVDQAGLLRVPVPVDADGLDVGRLEELGAQAVFVTPAHQFPTGVVLAKERRRALVDWLRDKRACAFEDDYDAEYRYDQNPVGALQGIAPEHVLYAGTVSKTLAPALRLGWLVVPAKLLESVKAEQARWNEGSPRIDQNALASLIEAGDYDRHLRTMRRIYRARRDALMQAIRDFLPEAEPRGIAAGLHVTLHLPDGLDEARICKAAAARGVAIEGLGKYRVTAGGSPALLLGYGSASEGSLKSAVRVLADALAMEHRHRSP